MGYKKQKDFFVNKLMDIANTPITEATATLVLEQIKRLYEAVEQSELDPAEKKQFHDFLNKELIPAIYERYSESVDLVFAVFDQENDLEKTH